MDKQRVDAAAAADPFTATHYDAIVLGSGLVECVLAAALARAHRRVLLVDSRPFYGGNQATLLPSELAVLGGGGAFATSLVEGAAEGVDLARMQVDLAPLAVLARGQAVHVIAESGVARYLEFHAVEGAFFLDNGERPIEVPHTKSAVFTSQELSLVDKRQLMRFLQAARVTAPDELDAGRALAKPQNVAAAAAAATMAAATSYEAYLSDDVGLSARLSRVVRFGVALLSSEQAHDAVGAQQRVANYLAGIGRFGPTPFIAPAYGTGEVCQAFSRLCAVYGGVCALDVRVAAVDADALAVEFAAGNGLPPRISAGAIVVGDAMVDGTSLSAWWRPAAMEEVHLVVVADAPVLRTARACLVAPPTREGECAVHGLQLDWALGAVPKGRALLHLVTMGAPERRADTVARLRRVAASIVVVGAATTTATLQQVALLVRRPCVPLADAMPRHVFAAALPSAPDDEPLQFHMDAAFARAKQLFETLCPGEPFLPPSQAELEARSEEAAEQSLDLVM